MYWGVNFGFYRNLEFKYENVRILKLFDENIFLILLINRAIFQCQF